MSRMRDRVHRTIRNLSSSKIVDLYNAYALRNHFEIMYHMYSFDYILYGTCSASEIANTLEKDFDRNADYFRFEPSGRYKSFFEKDIASGVDFDLLTDFVMATGANRAFPKEINGIFDGSLFLTEMKDLVRELPLRDVIVTVFMLDKGGFRLPGSMKLNLHKYFDKDVSKEDAKEYMLLLINQEYNYGGVHGQDYQNIYLLPRCVQEKFFDFIEVGVNYVRNNIGSQGPLKADEALAIAGFEKMYFQGKSYYRCGNKALSIEIIDGVIWSVRDFQLDNALVG